MSCNNPDHASIHAERLEVKELRKAWIKADNENQNLRKWIKHQGEQTDTCTYNILGCICEDCRCNRSPKRPGTLARNAVR